MLLFMSKSRRRLRKLLSQLKELSRELKALPQISDPLDRIVIFFNLTSPWYDRIEELRESLKFSSDSEIGKKLKDLFLCLEKSGRDIYGINRTKRGQMVTGDNVWLGDVPHVFAGLFTHTARYWKSHKDDDRNGPWGNPALNGMNPYDVITKFRVHPFIEANSDDLIRLVEELEQVAWIIATVVSSNMLTNGGFFNFKKIKKATNFVANC